MSAKDSAKGIAKKFRLNSHHTIERFGVIFGTVCVTGALLFSGAAVSAVQNQNEDLSSVALYTESFSTSKTQQSGDVEGIYVNEARDRALVLMQFENAASMSGNAEKYQAFLTGSDGSLNPRPLENDVTGEIVVFGSTGYMGMVLESDEPFVPQIMNLTLRANSELVYTPSSARELREDLKGQNSFLENDQWRLYFNPGASEAVVTASLDSDTFDPDAAYAELVVEPLEAEVRTKLDDQLGVMRADLVRIAEYTSELDRTNVDGISITPPRVPASIEGDEVVGELPVDEESESTLELKTEWVAPGGYDFDWRSGNVTEGYLDALMGDEESLLTFLADKAAERDVDASQDTRMSSIEWALSNGSLLEDFSQSDSVMKPLFDLRNKLSQAYQDYFTHKKEYQTKLLPSLIDLEVDLENVRSGSSQNTTEDVLFIY